MSESTPQPDKPKQGTSEAQKRASKKYYEANKDKWTGPDGYNSSEAAKEAQRRYDAKRGSRAEAMRKSRAKKKLEDGG
jgi:hypothetical protein